MANVEKVSVALTLEMASMIREAVASGEYASASHVIHEALDEWSFRQAPRGQALEELGRLWDKGMTSGNAVDGHESFARVRSKLDARIAEREA